MNNMQNYFKGRIIKVKGVSSGKVKGYGEFRNVEGIMESNLMCFI